MTKYNKFKESHKSYFFSSYPSTHAIDDCDKCGKKVGYKNLVDIPFLYLDMNDEMHKDKGHGYRQYMICKECLHGGY